MYSSTHTYICTHMPIYMYVHVFAYVYVYVRAYVYMYVYVYVCVCVYVYVHVYVYVYVYVYAYAYAYVHAYTYVLFMYMHTWQSSSLGQPYGKCEDGVKTLFPPETPYTHRRCIAEHMAYHMNKTCHCVDAYLPGK